MTHLYKVGQVLELRAAPRTSNRRAGAYEVIFCLPHEGGPVLYRVRSIDQNGERVVDQNDLSPSDAVKSDSAADDKPFSIAITRR
jgi:hypothetical protein